MWFVTLILLGVAAYLIWDALRDKQFIDSGDSLSSARRETVNQDLDDRGGNYRSTQSAAGNITHAGSESADQHKIPNADTISNSLQANKDKASASLRVGKDKASALLQSGSTKAGPIVKTAGAAAMAAAGTALAATKSAARTTVAAANDATDKIKRSASDSHSSSSQSASGQAGSDQSATSQSASTGTASAAAAGAAVASAAVASRASNQKLSSQESSQDSDLDDADLTGAWNTDVLIEVQERLKVLNTRESDIPRLKMTREEYLAIKDYDESAFTRERLQEILGRLRHLG